MSVAKKARGIARRFIPSGVRRNVRGLLEAARTYYPQYLFGDGKIKRLDQVFIELTYRCNCRCQMCPLFGVHTDGGAALLQSMRSKEELSTEEFSVLFRDLKQLGVKTLLFTGGEAFLRSDIFPLIRLAKENDFNLTITSNGGAITEDKAKEAVKSGVDVLILSLDGPMEVHNAIRKSKVFERIMSVVDTIRAEKARLNASKPHVSFLCTVSALNQDHLAELVTISKEKDVPLAIDPIMFSDARTMKETRAHFAGMEFVKKEDFIMPSEIGGVNVAVLKEEVRRVRGLAGKSDQPVDLSLDGTEAWARYFTDMDYRVVNKCLVPWYALNIDPYGNVYPCSISISMGNIREHGIKDIVNNDSYRDFRKKLKKNAMFPFCKKCCVLLSPKKYWNYLPRL